MEFLSFLAGNQAVEALSREFHVKKTLNLAFGCMTFIKNFQIMENLELKGTKPYLERIKPYKCENLKSKSQFPSNFIHE